MANTKQNHFDELTQFIAFCKKDDESSCIQMLENVTPKLEKKISTFIQYYIPSKGTALSNAVEAGFTTVCLKLLKYPKVCRLHHIGDSQQVILRNFTPLMSACKKGMKQVCMEMIKYPELCDLNKIVTYGTKGDEHKDLYTTTRFGYTSLLFACKYKMPELCMKILQYRELTLESIVYVNCFGEYAQLLALEGKMWDVHTEINKQISYKANNPTKEKPKFSFGSNVCNDPIGLFGTTTHEKFTDYGLFRSKINEYTSKNAVSQEKWEDFENLVSSALFTDMMKMYPMKVGKLFKEKFNMDSNYYDKSYSDAATNVTEYDTHVYSTLKDLHAYDALRMDYQAPVPNKEARVPFLPHSDLQDLQSYIDQDSDQKEGDKEYITNWTKQLEKVDPKSITNTYETRIDIDNGIVSYALKLAKESDSTEKRKFSNESTPSNDGVNKRCKKEFI